MKIDVSALEPVFKKLKKRDFALFNALQKKINQIAELDRDSINHFKNLRKPLNDYKRVHVGSFVLMFKVEGEVIIFDRFEHHDNAY
ncbi:MAG: addiction module toxin RelE [Candidatus Diapherotrites archaeon]